MWRVDCIWLWIVKMARLVLFVNLIAFVAVTVGAEETAPSASDRHERQSDDPNIFGVASIARVTSRNGRISSTGGIHFYPGPNGDSYNPATFIKAIDGKYATGSVQIHPGALGVSSSAQVGYRDPGYWPMDWQSGSQWPRQWTQWPVQSQYAQAPFGDPWTRVPQTKIRQQWVYPSFNPFFSFWR